MFKVSYVIIKLHNSSHLFKASLNNANQPKLIMAITIKIKFEKVFHYLWSYSIFDFIDFCHKFFWFTVTEFSRSRNSKKLKLYMYPVNLIV